MLVVSFFVFFVGGGAGMGPKGAPGDQLSNAGVSSKSGQWRPDWWRKCVLEKSLCLQPPVGLRGGGGGQNSYEFKGILTTTTTTEPYEFIGVPGGGGGYILPLQLFAFAVALRHFFIVFHFILFSLSVCLFVCLSVFYAAGLLSVPPPRNPMNS